MRKFCHGFQYFDRKNVVTKTTKRGISNFAFTGLLIRLMNIQTRWKTRKDLGKRENVKTGFQTLENGI